MAGGGNARVAVARVLANLLAGQGSLNSQLAKYADHTDAPLIQEMCFGVCRYFFPLQASIDALLDKPLRNKDRDVYCLMLAGAYQIYLMRIPDHAAVNETVQATRAIKKPWARGLVNSVLRRLIERQVQWQSLLASGQEEISFLHPQWLIDVIRQDWPCQWQQILHANNQRAPMCLRINRRRTTAEGYLRLLAEAGIGAHQGRLAASSIYLEQPAPVDSLPGFFDGQVSVQDEASQLVALLLDLDSGQRVLDACAAPGGKTGHILESEPLLTELLALDIDEGRTQGIRDNLQRLGLQAAVKTADASEPDSWWDGIPFQRILLDAPCSATGVIRRHPDIKILRQPEEIEALNRRQARLLESLWACLAPGGLLLYTTCSVLKAENDGIIQHFIATREDAKYHPIAADWGVKCAHGRQLLPETDGNDGFYYALLQKC